MQQRTTIVGLAHLRNLLPLGNLLTLSDQQLPVVPVSTQVFIVMFDDDKPAISDQSTAAVNHLSSFGSAYRIARRAGQLDALAQGIAAFKRAGNRAAGRPGPGQTTVGRTCSRCRAGLRGARRRSRALRRVAASGRRCSRTTRSGCPISCRPGTWTRRRRCACAARPALRGLETQLLPGVDGVRRTNIVPARQIAEIVVAAPGNRIQGIAALHPVAAGTRSRRAAGGAWAGRCGGRRRTTRRRTVFVTGIERRAPAGAAADEQDQHKRQRQQCKAARAKNRFVLCVTVQGFLIRA